MTRTGASGRSRSQGFTLIELMIVVAIVGIMTLLMIPEMKGSYEEAMLRSNARKLSSAFMVAYSKAISSHRRHRVRIQADDSKLIVEQQSDIPETPYTPLKQFERKESQLHPNVSIRFHPPKPATAGMPGVAPEAAMPPTPPTLPPGTFVFHPDGTSEGSDIELRDRMGFGLMLHLDPVTSRVRFENLPRVQR